MFTNKHFEIKQGFEPGSLHSNALTTELYTSLGIGAESSINIQ